MLGSSRAFSTGTYRPEEAASIKVDELGLAPADVIRISPPSSRHLRNLTLISNPLNALGDNGQANYLSRPADAASPGAWRYIRSGEALDVHEAYIKQFDWLVDLLIKLGREDDAYDSCTLIVPEWDGDSLDDTGEDDDADGRRQGPALNLDDVDIEDATQEDASRLDADLAALPAVRIRRDLVPDELDPARFFTMMLSIVLDNSTVAHHTEARHRRANPRA